MNYQFCLAMIISKISQRLQNEKKIRLDFSMIRQIFLLDFLLLIIFTIIYITFFGCFFITFPSTAQNLTLSSEGPAGEMYPDSMGEYMIHRLEGERDWYQHKERDDRFIMYSNIGKIVTLNKF